MHPTARDRLYKVLSTPAIQNRHKTAIEGKYIYFLYICIGICNNNVVYYLLYLQLEIQPLKHY